MTTSAGAGAPHRFLIFAANYWPEPLGSAVYSTQYAEGLAAEGHAATVVAAYPHYPEWTARHRRWRLTRETVRGVDVIRVPHAVPSTPTAVGRLRLEATYGLAAAAAGLARARRFDAAIGIVPALAGGLAAATVARAARRPYGILVHDVVSRAAAHGGVPGAGRHVVRALEGVERAIIPAAGRVSVVARGFEPYLRRIGATAIDYIPNFVTLGQPRTSVAATRSRLGLPEDAFVAAYSGNLGFKQDLGTVVEAAGCFRSEGRIRVLIVGDGSQRAALEGAARQRALTNVQFAPLQAEEDLPDVLRAADVLLAPQRATETDMSVPGKIAAYMAAARPIVASASDHSETARVIRESGGGIVVPPGDAAALAQAIERLSVSPDLIEELGALGGSYSAEHFDRERGLRRFCDFAVAVVDTA